MTNEVYLGTFLGHTHPNGDLFFWLTKKKDTKNRGGLEKPVNKPTAIPLQGCAHARGAYFAPTIAFFLVDPPSASGQCLVRERGEFKGPKAS